MLSPKLEIERGDWLGVKSAVLDDAVTPASNALLVPTGRGCPGIVLSARTSLTKERSMLYENDGKSTLLMTFHHRC